jgi:hypothetical protein
MARFDAQETRDRMNRQRFNNSGDSSLAYPEQSERMRQAATTATAWHGHLLEPRNALLPLAQTFP